MLVTRLNIPTPLGDSECGRFGIRAALIAGFGALLILMGVICVNSLRMLGEIQVTSAQLQRTFLSRETNLERIRSGLSESGNVVRDYILAESDPNSLEMLRAEFASIRDEVTAALKVSSQSAEPDEMESFEHLALELNHYWSTLEPIFKWNGSERQLRGYSSLRGYVFLQRATVLAIARELSAVNEIEIKEHQDRTTELFTRFRRSLQTMTLLPSALA